MTLFEDILNSDYGIILQFEYGWTRKCLVRFFEIRYTLKRSWWLCTYTLLKHYEMDSF